jgi:hypothetical protein
MLSFHCCFVGSKVVRPHPVFASALVLCNIHAEDDRMLCIPSITALPHAVLSRMHVSLLDYFVGACVPSLLLELSLLTRYVLWIRMLCMTSMLLIVCQSNVTSTVDIHCCEV